MKSKHILFIIGNILLCVIITYKYEFLSYLGILMIGFTHEFGHYVFAMFVGGDPEFGITSGGDPCVRHEGEYSLFVGSGGLIVNFLFLPIFVGMKIMNMSIVFMVLVIIVGSIRDIAKMTRILKGSDEQIVS